MAGKKRQAKQKLTYPIRSFTTPDEGQIIEEIANVERDGQVSAAVRMLLREALEARGLV